MELPKLRTQCYEPALAHGDAFQGAWLLNFVIQPEGRVDGVTAEPKSGTAPNAAFEACLARHVATWRFEPMSAALPVAKSVTFRPDPAPVLAPAPDPASAPDPAPAPVPPPGL